MAQGRITVLHEVQLDYGGGYFLCLQYCRFNYGNASPEQEGYRFTWLTPDGYLKRGQARIPSFADIHELMAKAIEAGWGHYINN